MQETQSYQRFQHVGHTVFNTSGTNSPRLLSRVKMGTHATPALNRAHSGSHGETRGVSDGGAITTLGSFCAVRKPCVAGAQNGKLCRFWVLVRGAPEERREPSEQRCAHACRCSEASRPRWAARSGEYAMDYVVSICTLDDNNNRLCRRSRNSCFCACGGGQIQHHN